MDKYIRQTIIEIVDGEQASVTSTIKRHQFKMQELHKEYPTETKIYEIDNHTIRLVFPLEWFKMPNPKPKRVWTEEQKESMRQHMKQMREKKGKNKE